jgi:hypothetical protein
MSAGIYNPWIEKSLDELAILVPGRYAKFEASSGLIASLDGYAYRIPRVLGNDTEDTTSDGATEADELSPEPDSGSGVEASYQERAVEFMEAG